MHPPGALAARRPGLNSALQRHPIAYAISPNSAPHSFRKSKTVRQVARPSHSLLFHSYYLLPGRYIPPPEDPERAGDQQHDPHEQDEDRLPRVRKIAARIASTRIVLVQDRGHVVGEQQITHPIEGV